MKCFNCSVELKLADNFCQSCGHPVPKEKRCQQCKKTLPDNARFCSHCGTPVNDSGREKLRDSSTLPITEKDFVSIPAGSFEMGCTEEEWEYWDRITLPGRRTKPIIVSEVSNERLHTVFVNDFELMKTPVTFAQYDQYCNKTGKDLPSDEG